MPKPKLPDKDFPWTPELAYVVGLLVTDGNLSSDNRHIVMRSSDLEMLETFKKCLGLNNKIGKTRNGDVVSYRVQFGSVQFYRWLVSIGLFPAKSYTIGEIKIPPAYFRDFVRGHLDGDGNISYYEDRYNTYKNRVYFATRLFIRLISASKAHMVWLRDSIQLHAGIKGALFSSHPKIEKRVPLWQIKFSKKDSIKLLSWIYYQPDLPCLKRKFLSAQTGLQLAANYTRRPYSRVG